MRITPEQLAQATDFDGLARLFHDHLGWPRERWSTFAGVQALYDIPNEELEGVVSLKAVQKLDADQSWGIFLVDFGPNELKRPQLRAVLNKVADKARQKHDNPTWPRGNVMFVCRSDEGSRFTLGHYKGDVASSAKLKTFGWKDPREARTTLDNLSKLAWNQQPSWNEAWDVDRLSDTFFEELYE